MKFTQAVKLQKNGSLIKKIGTEKFYVDKEFIWYLDFDNKKEYIIVESGFVTDFASIPRIFRIFFNPSRYISAVLHDKLRESRIIENTDGLWRYCGKMEADMIYFSALRTEWVSLLVASLHFLWLFLGWWYIYYFKS